MRVVKKRVWNHHPGDIQNVSGQGPEQPYLGWPRWNQGIGLNDPFQL